MVEIERAAYPELSGLLPTTAVDRLGAEFRVHALAPLDRTDLDGFYDRFEPKRAAQGLPPEGSFRIARWLNGILSTGTHLLVRTDAGVMGHAFLIPTDRPTIAEYAIFLDQEIRGRGIGTQVNRVAAQVAAAQGLQRLWLCVEPYNRPAIRSYQKAGFHFRPETILAPEAEMELDLYPAPPG